MTEGLQAIMSFIPALYYCLAFTAATHVLYRATVIVSKAYAGALAKIPHAHPICPFSSAWILWNKWHLRENQARHAAHQRLGPVIRIGPRELSIDCVEDGIRTVYGSWDKHSWYTDALQGDSAPYMLTLLSHSAHAQRRRMVASAYSKSSVMKSQRIQATLQQVIDFDFLKRLSQASSTSEALEVLDLNKSVYLDISTAWVFGLDLKTDLINNDKARHDIISAFSTDSAGFFLRSEFARLTAFLDWFRSSENKHNTFDQGSHIQQWMSEFCSNAEQATIKRKVEEIPPQDNATTPTIYDLLRQGLIDLGKSHDEVTRSLRAECLDHIIASYEVSGLALTYAMYELSLRPTLQRRLRAEILTLDPLSQSTAQEIDNLALLDAVLLETLRLHPSVVGPWPRIAPAVAGGVRLGPYDGIPAGTKVSASSWTLHMHEEVFPEAEKWLPERWLQATKEGRAGMMRWMWPYGSGARVCIGNHFANRSLKYAVSRVYRDFETTICEHGGMEHVDSLISGPAGGYLKLYFTPARDDCAADGSI